MKLVKYLSILVLTLFVVACSDDPDMGDKQEPNEDMISDYIKIKSNDLQGWDYGFINGKYIHTFVKNQKPVTLHMYILPQKQMRIILHLS